MKIFYKKSTAIAFIAAMLVLVLLICMLLVSLTQMASVRQQAKNLRQMVENGEITVEELKQNVQMQNTVDYIIDWAERNNYVKQSDINWVQENFGK